MGGLLLVFGAALLLLGSRGKGATVQTTTKKITKMRLSKNFDLSEFLRSSVYPPLAYYRPTAQELANLKLLVDKVLQPLRDEVGPLTITGGARPPIVDWYGLLKARGYSPSKNSDHADFAAADIRPGQGKVLRAFELLKKNPAVRQVILYTKGGLPDRIHVAVKTPSRPLIAKNFSFTKQVTA